MLIPFETLFKKYNIQSKGILHVGASLGQEAQRYADLGIKKMIFIEAIPDVFLQLKSNISTFPDAVALNACVSDEDGVKVKFNIANNEGQSSSFLEFGTHIEQHPTVRFIDSIELETVRLDSLLKDMNLSEIDFLVMDLQGAELLALKGMGDLLNKFKYAYLEVNRDELYVNGAKVEEIDIYLDNYGFKRKETKMLGFGWGDALYIKDDELKNQSNF